MKILLIKRLLSAMAGALLLMACGVPAGNAAASEGVGKNKTLAALEDSLRSMAESSPGEVGVALLTDRGDTVVVANEDKYPLMSVFKLHQAVSLCHDFERKGLSLDSAVVIRRSELNPDTWSPMLADHPAGDIRISVRELLGYTLTQSDNNASNWLFDNLQPVRDVDAFIATVIPRGSFRLSVTEADMWDDHSLCYANHSSPLGAAILIDRLFTDSIIGSGNGDFLRRQLQECRTGTDRIVAPLKERKGVVVAHKTGSGFRDAAGVLSAHNDVAYVMLPDGRHYTLAVLVKDFRGTEADAAAVIARISGVVYDAVGGLYAGQKGPEER